MIPPGNLPDWQRRIITLYFTDARDSFSHMMGFLWFNPDTITGKLSVQPIRYMRHIDVASVFADRSELDTYHPRTNRKRFSQRPNTLEYWEKYGSLVVASGLVPLSSISPASPPASERSSNAPPPVSLRNELSSSLLRAQRRRRNCPCRRGTPL